MMSTVMNIDRGADNDTYVVSYLRAYLGAGNAYENPPFACLLYPGSPGSHMAWQQSL